MWTKEKVTQLLQSNNLAVERAILVLYHRQTLDEQSNKETKHSNGVGFSGAHARLGTYYARWLITGNHLTGVHLEKARRMVLHYTSQLMDEILSKTNK